MILKQTILNLININIRNKNPKVLKAEHADVEEALLDAIFIPFQVIELDCTQQFIDDNFELAPSETMGLGKNLMVGYAMSNGNNGTRDRRKKVSVGYDPSAYVSGPDFSIMGNPIGSANAVLVEHDHKIKRNNNDAGGSGSQWTLDNSGSSTNLASTELAGESGINKNYQPSIVTLFIQRI